MAKDKKDDAHTIPPDKEGKIKVTKTQVTYEDPHKKKGWGLPASVKAIGIAAVLGALLALGLMLSIFESSTGGQQAGVQTPPGSNTAATPSPWHKGLLVSPSSAPSPVIKNGGGTGVATTAACAGRKNTLTLQPGAWVDTDKFNACQVYAYVPPGVTVTAQDADGSTYDLPIGANTRGVLRVTADRPTSFTYSRCPKGLSGDRNWDCTLRTQYANQ